MKSLAALASILLAAGCGMSHGDMMGASGLALMNEAVSDLGRRAEAHRLEAVELGNVQDARRLEDMHRPAMMDTMDGMAADMMDCRGDDTDSESASTASTAPLRDEMNRHADAIANCEDMDAVRREEDEHLRRMQDMMGTMKSRHETMMREHDARCPMSGH